MISDLYPVLKGKGQHKIIDKDKYARQLQSIINLYNPSDNRLSVYVDKADYSNGEYPNTDDKEPTIEKPKEQKDENKPVETTETPQVEQQSTEKEKVAEKVPEQATEASTEVSKDTDKKSAKKSEKKSKK